MKREADFDLRLLRCFVAVAEARSFSAAARRLNVAQPWLSHSIQRLERQIGFLLFERTTRTVKVSADGAALLAPARRLLEDAQLLAEGVRNRRSQVRGLLRLGTAHFLADLPERMRLVDGFITGHPDFLIEVRTTWLTRLVQGLLEDEIDAALMTGPASHPDLEAITLRHSPMELVVPKSLPLARRRVLSFDDLRGQRVGLWKLPANAPIGDRLAEALDRSGARIVPLPDDNFAASLQLAARQGLIVPGPAVMLDPVRLPPALVRRRLGRDALQMEVCVMRRRGRGGPALDALWALASTLATAAHS